MTFNQAPEFTRSVYDSCDPKYLRELREAAGMDLVVLARTACLSVAQVRQLESDHNDSLFYSDAIKRQAYKRLLMILGAEPPTIQVPQDLLDAVKVADAHSTTLDQIVAMSEQPAMNRSTLDTLHAILAKLKAHKQAWAALVLLVVALTLLAVYGPQRLLESVPVSTSAVTVESAPLLVPPPVAAEPSSSPSVVASSMPVAAPIAAASSPVSIASAAVVPTLAASHSNVNVGACAYSNEVMQKLTPFIAQKEGHYVYLVSNANVEVCVVDSNKQATALQLKAGESRSVYGIAPWQVSSPSLKNIQIFFQGGRVSLPDAALTRVTLVEVPVAR
jgi:hypothetical protein